MSIRARSLIVVPLLAIAACGAPGTTVSSPTPDASTSYVIRLGADTVGVERFTKAGNRFEAALVQRLPMTVIVNSNIEIGANGLATSWRYEARRANGTRPPNGATYVIAFGTDSNTVLVTRDTGATTTRRTGGGAAIPYMAGSMLTQNLAIAYARMQGRDSVLVPTVSANGNRATPMPVRFVTRDTVRVWYAGAPMYAKLDGDGQVRWLDGGATTNKIMGTRVPRADVTAIAAAFTAREATSGVAGAASPRDTARAQIMGTPLWIDYGRPSLRGRNAWVNGVLGDTLWRTGANAATQFRTESDLRIGGQIVPAGTYTLWTHAFPGNSRYELVINKQIGQWGTIYDPTQDLMRVPLTVRSVPASVEKFTMMIEPGGDGGVLAMQWGTTRLETPFTIVRR